MIYQYQERGSRRQRKKLRLFRFLFYVVGIIAFIYIGMIVLVMVFSLFQNRTTQSDSLSQIVSPLGKIMEIAKPQSKLPEVILSILENEDGNYGVVIENLKTGERYALNEEREFTAASLYKLWVMGAVYQKIEDGTLSKDRVMSDEITKINERFDIASESAELKEGEISMSVTEALEKMITISHNYAALLLSQTIRLASVRAFMKEYKYNDSLLDPPRTTASDIATFYKQLYEKKIINPEVSDEMIDLLKDQAWNDRIPKYLPENIVVAHKTGELDGAKHDAGIVFTDEGDYIIVLMSETKSQSHAAEVEAKISEAVYTYFTKS